MPEGDTIHRAARSMQAALGGRLVRSFEAVDVPGPRPAPGATVERVEARGKHLLVHFDSGISLHTHMGMNGSWHLYRPGERWWRPAHRARVVVRTDGFDAACFSPQIAKLTRTRDLGAERRLTSLGPDLTTADPDVDEAVRRLEAAGEVEVGVALLDQRVVSGIGNVFRSDVLFLCGVNPMRRVRDVEEDTLRRLVETAARLLRANLSGGRRRTMADGLAVYGRTGRPCRRCATTIRSVRLGRQARTVYWCPTCQPDGQPP